MEPQQTNDEMEATTCTTEPPVPVTLDNKYFYDPALFTHLQLLTDNCEVIANELSLALQSKIVPLDKENGAELSGVWCEDKVFDDFYDRTKGEEGWLHWWSVNNPEKPNNDWTIFGMMHGGKYMTENCKVRHTMRVCGELIPKIFTKIRNVH